MRCNVYAGSCGLLLVPDCMQASVEAEHAYGPLVHCGAFETNTLDPGLLARVDRALDDRSFATLDPDLALRLGYDPVRGLPLPNGFAWETADWWESDGRAALLYVAEGVRAVVAEIAPDEASRGWYAVTRAHRPWMFRGKRVTLSRPAAVQFLSIWVRTHAQELRKDFPAA